MTQTTEKTKRNALINPKFENGYAKNWAFPIPEVFQDALDIRITSKKDKSSSQTVKVLTQGRNYEFKCGHTFYNNILAYKNWSEFLNSKNPIAVQINDHDSTVELKQQASKMSKDLLNVTIYRPNEDKTTLIKAEEHALLANQIFDFLQSGILFNSDYSDKK